MIDKDFVITLKGVGLEEKEAAVYLALLELGKANATNIAKRAGLKRPIVYYTLERLKSRGYAQELPEKKVRTFSAADPLRILQNSQTLVEEMRFMLPLIRALQDKGSEKPRIEYFEGRDAIVSFYRLFEHRKNARFLTSTKRLQEFIPEEVEAWVRRYESGRSKHKMFASLLTDTPQDRAWGLRALSAGQQRRIRLLPKGMQLEMDFSIVDDMLSITSFNPLFIVVIHSEAIAHSAAQLFDLAWETGSELR